MTPDRRSSTKARIQVEALEDRITPVAIDPSLVHLAALRRASVAHAHGHHQSHVGPKSGSQLSPHEALNHRHAHHHPKGHSATNPTPPGPGATPPSSPSGNPTSSPSTTPSPSLPANVSQPLQVIYQEFQAAGDKDSFTSVYDGIVQIEGSNVGVQVHGNGVDFSTLISDMEKLGLQINATDATTRTIFGMLPISALPGAAQDPLTLSITPSFVAQQSAPVSGNPAGPQGPPMAPVR